VFSLRGPALGVRSLDRVRALALGALASPEERPVAEQLLLGAPAAVDQPALLQGVERAPELAADQGGEREVHVVAAQEDVIADGDPLEHQVAGVIGDLDQREVGGAAADVAHQDDIAGRELAPPAIAARREIGVERRLRLLEQGHAVEAGLARGDHGQLARDRVE